MQLRLPHRRADCDRWGLRAQAWFHQFELDRLLADGTDASSSPALQARARQLLSARFRRELVAQLDGVLAKLEHPPHWHSVSLPIRPAEVNAARRSLEILRQALLDQPALSVQGVALAASLLNDPNGPLYRSQGGSEISQLADLATARLAAPGHGRVVAEPAG